MVQLVKILRIMLVGLGIAVALLGVLAAVAFIPEVQTWYAQKRLDALPDLHGSVGSLSAGFSHVELTDLHL
ncbi:MAG: hypothetical protein ABI222_05955, partial [Opitutaceae bacterium]